MPMKTNCLNSRFVAAMLALCIFAAAPLAMAKSGQLSGPEAFALFHRSVFQMKLDLKAWLHESPKQLAAARKTAVHTLCLKGRDSKNCELAIKQVMPASVFFVREPRVFQLDQDLKTKYEFDVETGMRIFQLSTALRWMARKDVYNGVPAPRSANRKTYEGFLRQIESFHKNKALELRKAEPMIPPPPRR